MTPMLAAALGYIARGVAVFPCIPGGKRPLGRLVPNGFHGASTDPELVTRWFTAEPYANLGAPTGHPHRDVLDVDVKAAGSGFPAFNRLKAEGLLPVPLAIVRTPSGGLHVEYLGTAQTCGSLPKHHVDFKSTGGYIVLPPSMVDGRPYEVVREYDERHQLNWGTVKRFLDPPKPVRTVARPSVTGTGIAGMAAWLAAKRKPGRSAALYWAANRAVENGATEAELHELYRDMQFGDGFGERDAARTVADAYRKNPNRRSA